MAVARSHARRCPPVAVELQALVASPIRSAAAVAVAQANPFCSESTFRLALRASPVNVTTKNAELNSSSSGNSASNAFVIVSSPK